MENINNTSDKKELNWAVLGTGVIANQMASALHDMADSFTVWRTAPMRKPLHLRKNTE